MSFRFIFTRTPVVMLVITVNKKISQESQKVTQMSTIHTVNASSWPRHIHSPPIELLLFSPNTIMLPNACFRIRSNRWNIPTSNSQPLNLKTTTTTITTTQNTKTAAVNHTTMILILIENDIFKHFFWSISMFICQKMQKRKTNTHREREREWEC